MSLLRKEDDNMIEAVERLLYQAFPCKTTFASQAGSDGVSYTWNITECVMMEMLLSIMAIEQGAT